MTVLMVSQSLVLLATNSDIEVKRNALEALTSVVHNNWATMRTTLRQMIE